MPEAVRNALTAMARSSATREVCGFIMKDWSIRLMKNVSERDDQFRMDDMELLDLYNSSYYDLLGVFHSHCDGQKHPSGGDLAYAQPMWRYWVVTFEDVHEWELKDGRFIAA